jgi:hypothetical protein
MLSDVVVGSTIDLLSERDNSQHTQRSFEKLFGDAAAAAAEGMLQQRET